MELAIINGTYRDSNAKALAAAGMFTGKGNYNGVIDFSYYDTILSKNMSEGFNLWLLKLSITFLIQT